MRRAIAGALLGWLATIAPGAPAAEPAGVPSIRVVGTSLQVIEHDGRRRAGANLAGAQLKLGDPKAPLRLRIVSLGEGARAGITWHEIEIQDAEGAWRNPCQPDREGRSDAFFITGRTLPNGRHVAEPGSLSITCSSGVQAKCLRAGYWPWDDSRGAGEGLKLFQACTRMFRADYCGDGVAWTRDGMAIDFFDAYGIEKPEDPATMPFEAAWGEDGAVCVHHTRVPDRVGLGGLKALCPPLAARPLGDACSEDWARAMPGALLFNRSADALGR